MTLHPAPINSYHFYSSCSFWKRVFHKIERTVQTSSGDVVQAGVKFNAATEATITTTISSSASPSRPQSNSRICGEGKNVEIEYKWTNNNRGKLSESELGFFWDDEFLAAFEELVLDEFGPRAIAEEMDELELELGM